MNLFVFNQIQQRALVVLYGAPTLYGRQWGSVHKDYNSLLHSFVRRDSIVGAGWSWQRLNSPLPALQRSLARIAGARLYSPMIPQGGSIHDYASRSW